MMPLNTNIALGIRPFELEGPMDQATKALTLSGLIEQQRARQMQAQEAQRKAAEAQAYRSAMGALPPDASDDQRLQALRPFQTPGEQGQQITASRDRQVKIQQHALEVKAQMEAKVQAANQALAAKLEMAQQAGADRRTLMQMQLEGRKEIAAIAAGASNSFKQQALDIQRQGLDLRRDAMMDKRNVAAEQDASAVNNVTANMDRMAQEAKRLLDHPGLSKTTGLMSIVPLAGGLATVPGTDAANFKASLETLKSQVGFSVLQAMRDASKTGGALGQVSDFENKMLQSNLAALDRAQSEPEFKAALKKIVDYTDGAKGRMKKALEAKHRGVSGFGQSPTSAAGTIPAGVDPKVWGVMTPEERALWK